MAFTKQEFEELREDIIKVYESVPLIKDNYTIKKSTYEWSKKHNWYIMIDAHYRAYHGDYNRLATPKEKIDSVKALLDTTYNFISRDERNFELVNIVGSSSEFSYSFHFQSKKDRVKAMLTR